MEVTRRLFCTAAALFPFSAKVQAAIVSDDEKKPEPKPANLFLFNKKDFVMKINLSGVTLENIALVKKHLNDICVELEKDDENGIYGHVLSRIDEFNRSVSEKRKLILGPIDDRDGQILENLNISPDVIRTGSELVPFGFNLTLNSNNDMDIDTDSIALKKYKDPADKKIKEGILIRYTIPNPEDKDGEGLLGGTIIPIDVPVVIIGEKEAYFIDITRAFKPQNKVKFT